MFGNSTTNNSGTPMFGQSPNVFGTSTPKQSVFANSTSSSGIFGSTNKT